MATYLDVKGAFNNVIGVYLVILQWTENTLKSRVIYTTLQKGVFSMLVTRGIPQGGD